jgi:hypothetical protein
MTIGLRRLGQLAVGVAVVAAVLELALPCSVWRWIVGPLGILFALFAIAAVGTEATRPEIAAPTRAFVVWLSMCALLGAAGALLGLLC